MEEFPLTEWEPLIDLAKEILSRPSLDQRTARKFYISLGVLRKINGHPAVFKSEVLIALKSEKTKDQN